jgi:hypothetical protein
MTRTEALKLALDALGKFSIGYHVDAVQLNDLIATLEAALEQPEQEPGSACARCGGWVCDPVLKLEQPEQEPVASIYVTIGGDREFDDWRCPLPVGGNLLYAHPPRREWRGLTEEEIYPLYSEPSSDAEMVDFARAIEAALKEKNYG